MNIDFIQIGANVGNTDNDPVFPRVISGELKTGILIEANPRCMPHLINNYKGFDSLIFENCAIGATNGFITFYIDNYENGSGTSQHASNILEVQLHNHKMDEISEISVPCMTLERLISKYNLSKIGYLIVDAEGYDYNILINTDFSKINISSIQFEHTATDGPGNCGANYSTLISHLNSFGYQIVGKTHEDTVMQKNL